MKKHKQIAGWMLAVLMLAGTPSLFAEVIQGEIVEIDPLGTFLKVARSDPASGSVEPESAKVLIDAETQVDGVALADLRVRDEIWIEVEESEIGGPLNAKKILLDKVDIKTTGGFSSVPETVSEKGGV